MPARLFQPRRPLGRTGFVATAIGQGDVADRSITSLERLGHPAIGLVLFHAVQDLASWSRLTAPGGGFEQLAEEVARGRAG